MAELIRNVCVAGEWFGPAYGNATNVPADVAAKITNPIAWDTPPAPQSDVSAPGASADAAPAPQAPEPQIDAPAPQSSTAVSGEGEGDAERPQDSEPARGGVEPPTDILDGLDLDDLRATAGDEGMRVDKRWGEDRLRSEIRAHRATS